MVVHILLWCLVVWAATAVWFDGCRGRLPNLLILSGVFIAITSHWLLGESPLGVASGESLIVTTVGLVILVPLYGFGWLGGGDVKFLAVIGYLGGALGLLVTMGGGALLQLAVVVGRAVMGSESPGARQRLAVTHGPVFMGVVLWHLLA